MGTPPLIMGRRVAGDPARRSYDRVQAPFPTNAAADAFRRRFFPGIGRPEWNDWRWQLRNRLRTVDDLARIFSLSESERLAASAHKGPLPVGITPYYAHLLDRSDSTQGLRRTHIPDAREGIVAKDEQVDPLAEDRQSPVPGLVHRYPDRVLFLVTGSCATYCRYCTRSRMVGEPGARTAFPNRSGKKHWTISNRPPRSATSSCPAAIRCCWRPRSWAGCSIACDGFPTSSSSASARRFPPFCRSA
jgi:lysine 2,3-aminomutase